jgi:TPR repeat protein
LLPISLIAQIIAKNGILRFINMKSLVIALLFSLVSYQAFAKSSDELFDSGQYDKAFRAAYADALNGNSLDAFIIGRILLEGLGSAEKDQQLAVRFLEESADARNMGAAEYLGRAYYEAELLPKSNNLAYEYLSRAKGLGIDGLDDLLIEIASNLDGVISEQTCKLYFEDKKNPDFAFNLGQCIENAFLEGSANDFYLRAFDDGTVNALIPAGIVSPLTR